ncbi:MAG: hypothetical protein II118_05675, partial [Ruminococcus sp.]|nr:hypothetical protein [Ruminococcus sp.]
MKAYEKAETFIDRYSNSFEEYLSSVVNKLRDTDSEYKDIEERIAKLYEDYPIVKAVFDLDRVQEVCVGAVQNSHLPGIRFCERNTLAVACFNPLGGQLPSRSGN